MHDVCGSIRGDGEVMSFKFFSFACDKDRMSARQLEKLRVARDRLKDSALEMARYALKETDIERRAKFCRKFDEYLHRLETLD